MRATPSFRARGCLIISSARRAQKFFCAGLPNYLFKLAARGIFYPVERWRKPSPGCTVRSPRPVVRKMFIIFCFAAY